MAAKKLAGEDDDAQVEMVLGLSLGAQPKLVMGVASSQVIGLALGGNGFGLKLKHPTQVDAEDGCLRLAHGKDFGLSLRAQPKLVDGGASWLLKLATLMAQAYVELAHLVASTQKKDLYTSNPSKIPWFNLIFQ